MIGVLQERSDTVAGAATTIVLQFTNPVTPNSSIHVIAKSSGSPASITCADDVNGAHTAIGALVSDGGGGHRGQQFKFDTTGAGTPIVTATFSASVATRSILIREIGGTSGYDVQASQQQIGTPSSADGIDSGTASPSVAPGLVSGAAIIHSGTSAITGAGTGQTLDVHPLTGWGFTDSASEHFRYTDLAARAASFATGAGSSPTGMVFAAFFKETGAAANVRNGAQELMGVGA